MPLGRQAFGWQLKFQSLFVSDWKDPTPCQAVEEILKLEKLFPYQELQAPPPPPQYEEFRWTVDWTYRPSVTNAIMTPITLS